MRVQIPRNQIGHPSSGQPRHPAAPADVRMTDAAREAWERTCEAARERWGLVVWQQWLEPLRLLGERQGAVCVEAPPRITIWVRRRYGAWLGETIRRCSDMRGLYVYAAAEIKEEDRCL